MSEPLADGRSTPRYAFVFALGVVIGSGVRLAGWLLPGRVGTWLADRLLDSRSPAD